MVSHLNWLELYIQPSNTPRLRGRNGKESKFKVKVWHAAILYLPREVKVIKTLIHVQKYQTNGKSKYPATAGSWNLKKLDNSVPRSQERPYISDGPVNNAKGNYTFNLMFLSLWDARNELLAAISTFLQACKSQQEGIIGWILGGFSSISSILFSVFVFAIERLEEIGLTVERKVRRGN